jgi:alpha-1,3-mannosyltransferase
MLPQSLRKYLPSEPVLFVGILLAELILCVLIIRYVAYTEIDWIAYMQEVQGFESGQLDYMQLGGQTGPLVYPAGFLYVFYLFKKLSDDGVNIVRAQYLFAGISVLVLYTVMRIYRQGEKVPFLVCSLLILSKRVHSIFVLRCFNDTVAVLFGYAAVLLFSKHKHRMACIVYSIAVSIKMNMLLYAPGILLILLLDNPNISETAVCLAICASVQLVLGAPFLLTYPISYISRSFDLNRTFEYKWTVNLKFLPEELFVSKKLSLFLLLLTAIAYTLFAFKWIRETWSTVTARRGKATKLLGMTSSSYLIGLGNLSSHYIICTIFISNFLGIAFARTLHYQFYVWYWHMLPYLLWHINLPVIVRLVLLAMIEYSFNVFPATYASSFTLQTAHAIILIGLYITPAPFALHSNDESNSTTNNKTKKSS